MEEQIEKKQSNPYAIPVAILVAGLLVSGTIFLTSSGSSPSSGSTGATVGSGLSGSPAVKNIRPVSADDHILGDPAAPVKLVEFSDLECPFCKRLHPTIQRIMAEYGRDGRVAWVYRHFPLTSIHPKAIKSAAGAECANELGGNNAFWAYLDRYFEVTPSNNNINLAQLPVIAEDIGLDRSAFEQCLASGRYDEHIQDDFDDAVGSGGNGTPYSVVIAVNGKKFPIIGAQPYEQIKAIVDLALQEK